MLEDYLNRQELVKEYMPFVRKIAYDLVKSLPPSVSVEDLIQEGALGLIGAVERFDPQRNVKLSTYVMSRIKGAMLDYLRTIDWMPRTLRKQMKAIENKN
jgi:RNA polymerase sigma factor for flagellar operon FliA